MEGGDDDIAIDGLAAAGPILQNAFGFSEIDECLFSVILVDELFGL